MLLARESPGTGMGYGQNRTVRGNETEEGAQRLGTTLPAQLMTVSASRSQSQGGPGRRAHRSLPAALPSGNRFTFVLLTQAIPF